MKVKPDAGKYLERKTGQDSTNEKEKTGKVTKEATNTSADSEGQIPEKYSDLISDADRESGITMDEIQAINDVSEIGDKGIAPIIYSVEQIKQLKETVTVIEEDAINSTTITGDALVQVGNGSVLIIVDSVDKNHNREGEIITGFVATNAKNVLQACLSETERDFVRAGDDIVIRLAITNIEDKVPEEDAKQIEKKTNVLRASIKGLEFGEYIDITLQKKIGDADWQRIKELNEEMEVCFDVPAKLIAEGRTYFVLRDHEGECEQLNDEDANTNTITIRTHLFSTYAIIYTDEEVYLNSEPKGSSNWYYYVLAVTGFALFVILLLAKKKQKENQD